MRIAKQEGVRLLTEGQNFNKLVDLTDIMNLQEKQDMILLESADVVTKHGEKSVLCFDFALKVEGLEDDVVLVRALVDEAIPLLQMVANRFKDAVTEKDRSSIKIGFRPLFQHVDVLEKMRSISALDVLRSLQKGIIPQAPRDKSRILLVGAFAYDFLDHFEYLPQAKADFHNLPNFCFYLPLSILLVEHKKGIMKAICHTVLGKNPVSYAQERMKKRLSSVVDLVERAQLVETGFKKSLKQVPQTKGSYFVDIEDEQFHELVKKCKHHIKLGDVYQIVLSRTFFKHITDPIKSYQALRAINPSPHMFYLRTKDWILFGASPETFIKVDRNGKRVMIRPIAGTRRRGFNANKKIDEELDSRQRVSLVLDEKELAEHMMLVDLARNDVASISKAKSRRVKRLLDIDLFSHVMHLVSQVEGTLEKGFDALSAYQSSMNMGTLMGAPKIKAASLLRELENSKRGFYGGAVGYIDFAGNMDTAIVIRSALVQNGKAYIRAGCGVVHDSNPMLEVEETFNKAEAVLSAIGLGEAI